MTPVSRTEILFRKLRWSNTTVDWTHDAIISHHINIRDFNACSVVIGVNDPWTLWNGPVNKRRRWILYHQNSRNRSLDADNALGRWKTSSIYYIIRCRLQVEPWCVHQSIFSPFQMKVFCDATSAIFFQIRNRHLTTSWRLCSLSARSKLITLFLNCIISMKLLLASKFTISWPNLYTDRMLNYQYSAYQYWTEYMSALSPWRINYTFYQWTGIVVP